MPWSSLPCGGRGSEGGTILRDEELDSAARLTLERDTDCRSPAAITCGIYGWMVHTHFCDSVEDANRDFAAMKVALASIVALIPSAADPKRDEKSEPVLDAIGAFADTYP